MHIGGRGRSNTGKFKQWGNSDFVGGRTQANEQEPEESQETCKFLFSFLGA
jgi:hypothetical protein